MCLQMDQPGFGMQGRKYYLVERNDSMLMAYERLIAETGALLGGQEATVKQDAKDIVDFEMQLANV